ncbi:MAG: hypothetical protein WBD22_04175 [Pyrinomonadaceae bacterium]
MQVALAEDAGETVCELRQLMTQETEEEKVYCFIECGLGWTFYLTNLKSFLEGGIDLRNKNDNLHGVINA